MPRGRVMSGLKWEVTAEAECEGGTGTEREQAWLGHERKCEEGQTGEVRGAQTGNGGGGRDRGGGAEAAGMK